MPDARILLFSGQAVTDDLLKTALAQGYSFELLPKPIEPDVLVGKLRESSSDESSSVLLRRQPGAPLIGLPK